MNTINQLAENAIKLAEEKIAYRKETLKKANEEAISLLLGICTTGDFTYEQKVKGIITLQESIIIMEKHLAELKASIINKPMRKPKGRK